MDRSGEDVTRELESQPAKLEAHVHVHPKHACRCCQAGVCAASPPQRPIPGGIAGPGLVAAVIVSKFSDHLHLNRLEDIVARAGVPVGPALPALESARGCSQLLPAAFRDAPDGSPLRRLVRQELNAAHRGPQEQ